MSSTSDRPQPTAIGARVRIDNLSLAYDAVKAVDGVSLDIAPGEFVTILGPSGSGKTTTMMAIAGFASGYSGTIRIGEQSVDRLPPHRRNIGVVFQHLALFPHMSVASNIAFPLHMRAIPGAEVQRRVQGALDLVRLGNLGSRLPSQLSGGQQQRVALARALVFSPPVLLLDEPFGALDRKLRDALQVELKDLHRQLGLTILLVTHDQGEAISLSDRIAVMNAGRIAQITTPTELYFSPASRFVADFVGESVFLSGRVRSTGDGLCMVDAAGGLSVKARYLREPRIGDEVQVMIRPEHIRLSPEHGLDNVFEGTVARTSFLGDHARVTIALAEDATVVAVLDNRTSLAGTGARVSVGWAAVDALAMPPDPKA